MGKKKAIMKTAHLFSGENNQFRMKFNRTKHPVLNAKVKGAKGNRMSKAIAYVKRKEQWEKKQTAQKKANRFIDKRLLDPSMSLEDQATARFVRERQRMGKRNKFNLNDDEEELTHKGKPLEDIEDWNKDTHESDDEDGGLDANFVSKAHFGGFASDSKFEAPKTHKELVEELIINSKQKKQEQKNEKEMYINSQELVDKEWKEIHMMTVKANTPLFKKPSNQTPASTSETKDDYDVMKLELKFEPKTGSITHAKTPEEIAKAEEEARIQREKERLARMTDPEEVKPHQKYESADALCDEYDYLQPVVLEDNDSAAENSDNEVEMPEEEEKLSETDQHFKCNIPDDLETFKTQLQDCDPDEIYEVVDSYLKNTIRSKNEKVKIRLVKFFGILMQYALDCCEDDLSDTQKAGVLLPHLHSLAEVEPHDTADKFLDLLDEEQQLFQESKANWKKCKNNFPRLQTLTILRFTGLIYSVSDHVHPIALPAMDLMSDIVTSKFVNNYSNLVSRLLVSNIWFSFVKDSKKLAPEIINFLDSILKLAIPTENENRKFTLILNEKSSCKEIPKLDVFQPKKSLSDEDKTAIIFEAVSQLNKFSLLYANLISFKAFFKPTVALCKNLPLENYASTLQESIKTFVDFVENKQVTLRHLTFPVSKPKGLKMYEPRFECKYNKKDDIAKKRQLIKRVTQKIRKEERGMMREIRQDSQMVMTEKLKKTLELDAERKRKVKEIYAQLAEQEGEYKKMMKKK